MTSQKINFERFFIESGDLTPKIQTQEWIKHRWVIKAMATLARWRWKDRDPVLYTKALCSILSAAIYQTSSKFPIPQGLDIVVPLRITEITNLFKENCTTIVSGKPLRHVWPSTEFPMPWLFFCEGVDITPHIWAHVQFIWTAISACTDDHVTRTDNGQKENAAALMFHHQSWTNYLESLVKAYCSAK